jgi:ESX secretion system protein EccE
MTDTSQRVRAVAQVGGAAPTGSDPGTLAPRRDPGHLGPVHVMQLLVVEAALVAVVAAVGHNVAIVAAVAGLALAVLVVALARRQGRWWLERRLIAHRYRQRRSARTAGGPLDPRLAALRALSPGLAVEDLAAADGAQVGVARDDAGWYAVAMVTPHAPMRDDPTGGLPLDLLVATLVETGQPGATLQVVTHTVPPGLAVDPGSPAGQSYRQLASQFTGVPLPVVDRAVWIAVRLDAQALAEAGADDMAEVEQAPQLVAALVRQVTKALRRVGVPYQVLGAEGLIAALARSCDLEPDPETGQPAGCREDWAGWSSAQLVHRTFWVRDWPPLPAAGALLAALAGTQASLTSVALILVPDGADEPVGVRCLARVAAPAPMIGQVARALVRAAEQAGGKLFALDGEQGPGAYASAPTGGGPQ